MADAVGEKNLAVRTWCQPLIGEIAVTFVNEKILPADQAKNGFTSNSRFYIAQPSQWTVERARDMFLVHRLSFGPGGTQSIRFWAFKWNGQVFDVEVDNLSVETGLDGVTHARKRVCSIDGRAPSLVTTSQGLLADLKDALTVYGVAGLLLPSRPFQLELEICSSLGDGLDRTWMRLG